MSYDGKLLRRALSRFDADKQRRRAQQEQTRESMYRQTPRLREIEQQLRGTMSQVIRSAFARGSDPLGAIAALREENLGLQRERAALLAAGGYDPDFFEDKPFCPLCRDSGYVGGAVCRCLQRYYHDEQIRELSQMLDLGTQSFETFSFDWYSPAVSSALGLSSREQMESNYDVCRDYAYEFGARSGNLLLCGESGLGKTFLSACIARVVSESGHSVVYDTAGHIFERMEAVKFRREEEETAAERYESCDLLILDDLGTEMVNAFVVSALYQLVNGRLLQNKKTVISTNLNPAALGARYGKSVQSRLEGEYRVLPFFGEDIRKLRRQR